jgi:hypothetical protein
MGERPDELRPREIIVRLPRADEETYEVAAAPETGAGAPEDAELNAARVDIERTRAGMTSTVDAIQDRLDPEVLSEQAKDTAHDVTDYAIREAKEAAREITDHAILQAKEAIRDVTGQAKFAVREATIGKVENMARSATETAGGWRQGLVETIKANPMPAALVGLGLGWIFLNRPSSSTSRMYDTRGASTYADYPPGAEYGRGYGYSSRQAQGGGVSAAAGGLSSAAEDVQDKVGQVTGRAQETAGEVIGQVQGGASQVIDQVQETGSQVVDQVQNRASQAQSFLQRQLEENPLVVGAVAVAIGGVLAATVRSTAREDQLLGEARDRLVGTAKELTQDTMDKVGRVVDQAQTTAKEAAREESLVPEPGSDGGAR